MRARTGMVAVLKAMFIVGPPPGRWRRRSEAPVCRSCPPRVRDLIHRDEPVGNPPRGDPVGEEGAHLILVEIGPGTEDQQGHRPLLPGGVAYSDHRCLGHIGVIGKVVLQLEATDPLPARLDHIFGPDRRSERSPTGRWWRCLRCAASRHGTAPGWTGRRAGSKRRLPTARASNSPVDDLSFGSGFPSSSTTRSSTPATATPGRASSRRRSSSVDAPNAERTIDMVPPGDISVIPQAWEIRTAPRSGRGGPR